MVFKVLSDYAVDVIHTCTFVFSRASQFPNSSLLAYGGAKGIMSAPRQYLSVLVGTPNTR